MRSGHRFSLTLGFLLAVAFGGCRSMQGLPQLEGGVEIGLRRGASWSTYTVKPPHVIGSRGSLELRRGRMTGSIGGRGVNLAITKDRISGHAGGTVEIDIFGGPDDLDLEGLWNGARVHFRITPDSLRGTITKIEADTNTLASVAATVGQCQYVLDNPEPDGVRTGISICSGLPEETRIEFPPEAQRWFTQTEQVAVLLALLASPPLTALE
jgi:hypothetical protein